MKRALALFGVLFALAMAPAKGAELSAARVVRLDNGLTVIALEMRARPLVSVQTLYQAGGRDDPAGRIGLAHFVEHIAFRQSAAFPGTGLVDAIYDAGGEWHGYTWIDQTTYFSTAPKEAFGLLLDIEAERMDRLVIDEADVDAEIGAVLAEMDGYEDDPDAAMFDALAQLAFAIHPYRNNTIGFEGDVKAITPADVRRFYEARYRPRAAVLAIAGDIDLDAAIAAVDARFSRIATGEPATLPPSPEPEQTGPRRFLMTGRVDAARFKAAFPAPAAHHPDYAAFLVAQELLGGGEGVNFRQSDWGAPARDESALANVAENVTSWFIPTADPYLFVISGEAGADTTADGVASSIAEATKAVREGRIEAAALDAAKARVRQALAHDIETTEDAAHQLAFFAGLGALDALIGLDAAVAAVTAEDVARATTVRLAPERVSLVWMTPRTGGPSSAVAPSRDLAAIEPRPGAERPSSPVPSPSLITLAGGVPAILAPDPTAPSVRALVVAPGAREGAGATIDAHALATTSFAASGAAGEAGGVLQTLEARLAASTPPLSSASNEGSDGNETEPGARLAGLLSPAQPPAPADHVAPRLVVLAGGFDPTSAATLLEDIFGDLDAGQSLDAVLSRPERGRNDVVVAGDFAQDAVGYLVAAPAPGAPEALAYRLALYILTHEYGGRLGAEAISKRGLVYYIDSAYRGDRSAGLITLQAGVAPPQREAFAEAVRAELDRLVSAPPTIGEIAAAKRHLIGRAISAAQSPSEVADALATTWLATGALGDVSSLREAVEAVAPDAVRDAARALGDGELVVVAARTATDVNKTGRDPGQEDER